MADEAPEDKAALAQGAGEADLDPAVGGGNPAPAEPSNEPPAEEGKETPAEEANDPPAEETPAEKELDTAVWGSTGDEVGDSVLTLLQNADISTDEAKALMFDAVQAGDITKIDKAALIEKVGKATANLILAGTENFIRRNADRTQTILNEVHTAVGGEDNWGAITEWAKTNVSDGDISEYREMIDAGGAKARFAAQELANRFNGDDRNTTLDAGKTEIIPGTKAPTSGKAYNRADYVAALEKAYDRGASEAEIKEINAARARGRAKGI